MSTYVAMCGYLNKKKKSCAYMHNFSQVVSMKRGPSQLRLSSSTSLAIHTHYTRGDLEKKFSPEFPFDFPQTK